jgi:Acyl-CoA carboxylase epsilon subunit
VSRVSDGNETNNSATVTTEAAETAEAQHPHEPHIQILKGHPTDVELAALIAVLGSAGNAPPPEQPESTRWGLPVDKLRYAIFNYQRVTLQERVHMRR